MTAVIRLFIELVSVGIVGDRPVVAGSGSWRRSMTAVRIETWRQTISGSRNTRHTNKPWFVYMNQPRFAGVVHFLGSLYACRAPCERVCHRRWRASSWGCWANL